MSRQVPTIVLRLALAFSLLALPNVARASETVAQQLADDGGSLPARRLQMNHALSRCKNLLSPIDCDTARVDALENYQADTAQNNNPMLCRDRGVLASAIVYQARLNNGEYMLANDKAMVDQLLGELIDNCPDRAASALKLRRVLDGM